MTQLRSRAGAAGAFPGSHLQRSFGATGGPMKRCNVDEFRMPPLAIVEAISILECFVLDGRELQARDACRHAIAYLAKQYKISGDICALIQYAADQAWITTHAQVSQREIDSLRRLAHGVTL